MKVVTRSVMIEGEEIEDNQYEVTYKDGEWY